MAKNKSLRRVESEDIKRIWHGLSLEQRREALTIPDNALAMAAADAMFELRNSHECALACGFSVDENPFQRSTLLREAFSFDAQGNTLNSDLSVIAKSTFQMKVNEAFFQRPDFFEELESILPDFCSKSQRKPLPRAQWKYLWEVAPPNFAALEQLLAATVEQATWAMAFTSLSAGPSEPAAAVEVDDSWADMEDAAMKAMQAKRKEATKKKAKGKKRLQVTRTSSSASEASTTLQSASKITPAAHEKPGDDSDWDSDVLGSASDAVDATPAAAEVQKAQSPEISVPCQDRAEEVSSQQALKDDISVSTGLEEDCSALGGGDSLAPEVAEEDPGLQGVDPCVPPGLEMPPFRAPPGLELTGECKDHRLADIVSKAWALPPEQLLAHANGGPCHLSSVYYNILCLKASLDLALCSEMEAQCQFDSNLAGA